MTDEPTPKPTPLEPDPAALARWLWLIDNRGLLTLSRAALTGFRQRRHIPYKYRPMIYELAALDPAAPSKFTSDVFDHFFDGLPSGLKISWKPRKDYALTRRPPPAPTKPEPEPDTPSNVTPFSPLH